ncbi:MAG: immunity protein Imm5 [Sphingobacterium sp.]|jgi:hypothetical protein|nr:immunity protein Imm5 [Sphingobacterium sp.]
MRPEIIEEAKVALSNHPQGHLHLANRIQIAGELNDPTKVNKVFLACCKFVYAALEIDDAVLSDMLDKAESFLYAGQDCDFAKLYGQYKNYLEAVESTTFSTIGLACLSLCLNLSTDAASLLDIAGYAGADDDAYDSESWSPDLFASYAYADGSPFLAVGSRVKRIEIWNFFLDTVVMLSTNPDAAIGRKIRSKEFAADHISRTKDFASQFVTDKIDRVIQLIIKDLKAALGESPWKKVEIEGQDIGGKGMKGWYVDDNDQKTRLELTYYLYDGDESTVDLLTAVKEYSYQQSPEEGTWFAYTISIFPDGTHHISYNFDHSRIYADKDPNLEPFIEEFRKYPRAKDFTPKWWQEIITRNKLEYLKSS